MAEAANSITAWKEKYHRAKNQIANMKEDVALATEMITDTVMVGGGGALAGALDVKMPKLPGTDIDSKLGLGTLLCGLAAVGAGGDYSRQLNALGSGMLAVTAAEQTKKMLSK